MKRTSKIILAIIVPILLFISCELNDEDDDNTTSTGYTFQDQDLQGKIDGTSWVYQSGTAEISYFDNTNLSIDIYCEDPDGGDPCGSFAYYNSDDMVMFSVTNDVGVYELGMETSFTITLYENVSGTNYICTEGAVEILTIDTSGSVTGRIDARFDSDNYVNGNFTVTFCSDE